MKTIVPFRKQSRRAMPALFAGLCLAFLSSTSAATSAAPVRKQSLHDSITVQKQVISRKFRIRLYPDARHEVLFFNASGDPGRVFQFYLFDLDGRLVRQAFIRNKETVVIDEIEKGNYLFEIFSNDERLESGQVIVR